MSKSPVPDASVYQLKVTIRRSRPAIWRRILVPSNCALDLLHLILQRALGWTNVHLHDFFIHGEYYGDPAVDNVLGFRNECDYTLDQLITKPREKFLYEYDFGDDWEHEIILEKIVPRKAGMQLPACLAGERACPPEECGGIWSYYKLTEILRDPKHPEYKQTRRWFGIDFDAEEFNLKWINKQLGELSGASFETRLK